MNCALMGCVMARGSFCLMVFKRSKNALEAREEAPGSPAGPSQNQTRSASEVLNIIHDLQYVLECMQDAGKKQVAAMLGVQSARAATQPRPFLRLSRQHLAVQVRSLALLLLSVL